MKTLKTKPLSQQMPLSKYASMMAIDSQEEKYILDNETDTHYENNSALPKRFISLSYPVYNGDYYFAFISESVRVNAQYNAKANRKLRELAKTFKFIHDAHDLYHLMDNYFQMQFKDAGAGDTMTREELWVAVLDITGNTTEEQH
tara:strand:+ start:204 stop:638 length:435 start_codon:yes stop_codon:yes gene_type:complete